MATEEEPIVSCVRYARDDHGRSIRLTVQLHDKPKPDNLVPSLRGNTRWTIELETVDGFEERHCSTTECVSTAQTQDRVNATIMALEAAGLKFLSWEKRKAGQAVIPEELWAEGQRRDQQFKERRRWLLGLG